MENAKVNKSPTPFPELLKLATKGPFSFAAIKHHGDITRPVTEQERIAYKIRPDDPRGMSILTCDVDGYPCFESQSDAELIRRALEFFRAGGYELLKELGEFQHKASYDEKFLTLLRILDCETGEGEK